ncbi:MAG: HAD-IB family hydrolase, partial [Gammaproteobacteria bacterium]|nr:HAD-IB family hydrolase [Gammaproteobacteria bacterium]
WLGTNGELQLSHSIFYSDSINDLALLERVAEAVAVDPDAQLLSEARERGWRTLSLRG